MTQDNGASVGSEDRGERYVYISGMDEWHGPMPERDAWSMANDHNRLNIEINCGQYLTEQVWTIAIVTDRIMDDPWSFTAEHPADNPRGPAS